MSVQSRHILTNLSYAIIVIHTVPDTSCAFLRVLINFTLVNVANPSFVDSHIAIYLPCIIQKALVEIDQLTLLTFVKDIAAYRDCMF